MAYSVPPPFKRRFIQRYSLLYRIKIPLYFSSRTVIASTEQKTDNMHSIPPNKIQAVLTICRYKKLCDGLDITLGDFFDTEQFDNLEQEIK